jgi:RTX calcium-binding nonapeptide repeat (4 copies)
MAVTVNYSFEPLKTEFIANGYQLKPQYGSSVLGLANGGYAVSYANDFGVSVTPHISFYRPDSSAVIGPLGTFFLPYSGPASGVAMIGQPDIALRTDGNVTVTWLTTGTYYSTNLYSAVLNPATGEVVQSQTLISNYNINEFDAAVLNNGNTVYAFKEYNSIYLGYKDVTGQHIGTYGPTSPFSTNTDLSLAALKDGNFVLIYHATGANGGLVYQTWKPDGGAAGAESVLSATGSGKPVVGATANGGFAVAYIDSSVAGDGLMLQIVPPSSAIDPTPIGPIRVDIDFNAIESQPAITVLENGFILVTWTHPTGAANNDILGRLFSDAGRALAVDGSTDPFVVAGDLANEQGSSLSALVGSGVVVSWTDDNPDAQGSSIRSIVDTFIRTAIGDGADNVVNGSKAVDVMSGMGGNDTLSGGLGNDRLYGGEGNDIMIGGTGADILDGGTGDDTYVTDGKDTIIELLDRGIDIVKSTASIALAANIENLALIGTANSSGTGNELANIITGNDHSNRLDGGNDALVDHLVGGLGNDTYILGANTNDIVDDTGGNADAIESTINRSLADFSGIENLILKGTSAVDGTGNLSVNMISGNAADNRLDGGNDAVVDDLRGGLGNDTYVLGAGGVLDLVKDSGGTADAIESSMTLTLVDYAAIENLTLTGSAAINGTGNGKANVLIGNDNANNLNGNAGVDTLNGKAGSDILTGGLGGDKFVFDTALDSLTNVDRITDFQTNDSIILDKDIFAALAVGFTSDEFLSFPSGTSFDSIDAHDMLIYFKSTGQLYYDADGSGAAFNPVLFAELQPGIGLNFGQLLLVD